MSAGHWLIRVQDARGRVSYYCGQGVTHPQAPCALRFPSYVAADTARAQLGQGATVERARAA